MFHGDIVLTIPRVVCLLVKLSSVQAYEESAMVSVAGPLAVVAYSFPLNYHGTGFCPHDSSNGIIVCKRTKQHIELWWYNPFVSALG